MSEETCLALLVDWKTASHIEKEEIKKTWIVKNREEAEKTLETLLINPEIKLILTSNRVFEWVKPTVSKEMKNRQRPLIVCLAGKKKPQEQATILTEMAKRIGWIKG